MKNISLIQINSVSKKFKSNYVLKNINLEIEEGKVYGFIGHNGSGKTMLFRTICNFINITEGEVIVKGKKLVPSLKYPMDIGVIIESPGFINEYSGFKNLKYLAEINKKITDDEINNVLKKLGLFEKKDLSVKKYSLGMRQRLGIAQAIMEKPDLFIFDEPINALDKDGIELFKNIILELKKEKKTVLIATHNQQELKDLFDNVITMSDGEIIEIENKKGNENYEKKQ